MGASSSVPSSTQSNSTTAAGDPAAQDSSSSDTLHTVVVLVGLCLMFGAVLFTVIFYGTGGETNAIAILGVFLPAVTGVVGFVYGIKTGTNSGTTAGKTLAASTKKDAVDSARIALGLITVLEPALDNALYAVQTKSANLASIRDDYNRNLAQLKGRLKQTAGIV